MAQLRVLTPQRVQEVGRGVQTDALSGTGCSEGLNSKARERPGPLSCSEAHCATPYWPASLTPPHRCTNMSEVKYFCPKSKQVSRETRIQSRVLAQHPRPPRTPSEHSLPQPLASLQPFSLASCKGAGKKLMHNQSPLVAQRVAQPVP